LPAPTDLEMVFRPSTREHPSLCQMFVLAERDAQRKQSDQTKSCRL